MAPEQLWQIQLKRIDKNGRVSWRTLRQPATRKPLVWTDEDDANNYAICYCGFHDGRARVVPQ
jgi:hypothetical protein